jgi:hypothetical protein
MKVLSMAMRSFYQIVGQRALRETRCAVIPEGMELPAGKYAFMEWFCDDPACDCRRVIIQVWREDTETKIWATLTYGWDTPAYYAQWSHCGMGAQAEEMATATLEQISPQTEFSHALLDVFKNVLLQDADYVARLKRHYQEACPSRPTEPARVVGISPAEKRRRRLERRRRR